METYLVYITVFSMSMFCPNMEDASVGAVSLVSVLDGAGRGLDVHVLFLDMWQGGASTSLPRVSQGESL